MSSLHGLLGQAWLLAATEEPRVEPDAAPIVPEARAPASVEAPTVLVIGAPADDSAVRRVAAELEAIGMVVQIEITTEPTKLATPELDPSTTVWRAIVRVDTSTGEVSLFVRDGSGRTTARIVERGPDEQPASEVVLAHRTVEMLRASLRHLASAPAEAADPAPAARPVAAPSSRPQPPPRRHDRLFVLLGAAITGSPGGLAPIGHASVGLRWQVHPRVGLALRGLGPVHARRLQGDEGSATAWLGTTEAWTFVGLARPTHRFQPDIGVGAGAVVLGTYGRADAPLQSSSDLVVAATLAGGMGLSVWLHARVRLRVDGFVGVALPRPGVRFAGAEVATWGRPFGGGTLGVEIGVL